MRADSEKKKFDSRHVPTFLQKTYNLVDVACLYSEQGPPGCRRLGRGTEHLRDQRSQPVRPRGIAALLQTEQDEFFRQTGTDVWLMQLNMYDFHKRTASDNKHHVFYHPLFQKGQEARLACIKRKKNGKKEKPNPSGNDKTDSSKQAQALQFLADVDSFQKVFSHKTIRWKAWTENKRTY